MNNALQHNQASPALVFVMEGGHMKENRATMGAPGGGLEVAPIRGDLEKIETYDSDRAGAQALKRSDNGHYGGLSGSLSSSGTPGYAMHHPIMAGPRALIVTQLNRRVPN